MSRLPVVSGREAVKAFERICAYYVAGILVLECSRCKKPIIAIRPAVEGREVDLSGL